jgi:hypothetical protein
MDAIEKESMLPRKATYTLPSEYILPKNEYIAENMLQILHIRTSF